MPHYPDEIDYSDKYTDEHYEYRHVHLPKDVYKKIPRSKLLTESVNYCSFRNGDLLEYNNQEDGYTMSSINHNPIFFYSEDL
jgi:cyclin-dependent kinase regulatory subunit CKS1